MSSLVIALSIKGEGESWPLYCFHVIGSLSLCLPRTIQWYGRVISWSYPFQKQNEKPGCYAPVTHTHTDFYGEFRIKPQSSAEKLGRSLIS